MSSPARPRIVYIGIAVTAAALVIPLMWIPALVFGILLLVRGRLAVGIPVIVLGVVVFPLIGVALWQAFVVKPYRIPSESMQPAVKLGDRILVLKLGYEPRVGDIVIFHPPAGAEVGNECGEPFAAGRMCTKPTPARSDVTFIKRIVAGPGDEISMEGGLLVRNGKRETGIRGCAGADACEFPQPITIPPDHWFMLGDNRGASDDSRFWGPVPSDAIIGRKLLTYWNG